MESKRIELESVYGDYSIPHNNGSSSPYLCKDALAKYFDLRNKPQRITVVTSSHPSKNSYFVKLSRRQNAVITLSSGMRSWTHIYFLVIGRLSEYPKGCYVSIEVNKGQTLNKLR